MNRSQVRRVRGRCQELCQRASLAGDRESLLEAMATEIGQLVPGDLGVLVNYYSSYRATDQ